MKSHPNIIPYFIVILPGQQKFTVSIYKMLRHDNHFPNAVQHL